MTDAPPPQMPPPQYPPPEPPAKEPGFLMCGIMFFGAVVVVGTISGGLASVISGAAGSRIGAIASLVAIGVAVYFAVTNPRFGRCFLKGLAVNAAVAAILIGVCFAMVTSMYN